MGICIGISIFPHFYTQTHTYAGTNHTSSCHPILFALFHLCRSLSHTLSPSSLQLSLSLVRFRSLSLPLTVSLLSRAAESASSLCPNTDRLSNTNLRRKKIRRVWACACVSRSGVSAQAFVLQHLRSLGADSAGKKKRNLFHTRVYPFEESRKKKVFSSSASFVRDGQWMSSRVGSWPSFPPGNCHLFRSRGDWCSSERIGSHRRRSFPSIRSAAVNGLLS